MKRSSSGILILGRQWSAEHELVHDTANDFLITSTGPALKFWTLLSVPPALISKATFRAGVRTAFLSGSTAIALLDDGSLWTADMSQLNPAPVGPVAGLGALVQLARSDRGIAATEVSSDATTTIHFWSGNNLSAAPVNANVPGVPRRSR